MRPVAAEGELAADPVGKRDVLRGAAQVPIDPPFVAGLVVAARGEIGDPALPRLATALDEIRAEQARLRSPLVLDAIEKYLDGHRYPLSMIVDMRGF